VLSLSVFVFVLLVHDLLLILRDDVSLSATTPVVILLSEVLGDLVKLVLLE